jgi:transposase
MDTHLPATTLTSAERALVRPLLPVESKIRRLRLHSLRTLLNASFYAVRVGHAWRLLPQRVNGGPRVGADVPSKRRTW